MRIYDKDKLDNHYNNILKSNTDKIMLGGIGDTLLYDAKNDARMSLGRTVPVNIDEYINTIAKRAKEISAFEILFDGMTASDNVAMVKGYYEEPLKMFRKMLRDNLKQQGLPLEERYETFSSHISVARIPNKLKKQMNILIL